MCECMCTCMCTYVCTSVKSGSDDPGYLGNLGHFLVGQVDLISKLIIWMWPRYHTFFRKQCWHLVTEWTLGLMNALKYYWYETNLSSCMWCPKISSSRSLYKGLVLVLYPTKNEEVYGTVPYQKNCHVTLATFKKKTSTCGSQVSHMWVTSGLFYGSGGQMGQQMRPTFNPDVHTYIELCEWYKEIL